MPAEKSRVSSSTSDQPPRRTARRGAGRAGRATTRPSAIIADQRERHEPAGLVAEAVPKIRTGLRAPANGIGAAGVGARSAAAPGAAPVARGAGGCVASRPLERGVG